MQKGKIELRGSCWLLRYREPVLVAGKVVMKQTSRKLATYCDQYRTEKSVRALADEILAPINAKHARPESGQTLGEFLEHVYLPSIKESKKPSTYRSYLQCWRHIEPHLNGEEMRDFRTSDVDRLLRAVAGKGEMAHTTHRNIRNFLSGGFRYARRLDLVNDNPVRDAVVPRGKPAGETHAYTLDELAAMLKVLPEPGRTAVLVAGLTGLRVSEIKGLRWEDYTGNALQVRRAVWSGHIADTKTIRSRAAVPVVAPVREALEAHRRRVPGNGFIFAGATGQPLRLENEFRRVMKPALVKAGIVWHGWHGFRRGVGTILNSLGVDDITIQAILRHGNVATTQAFYMKALPKSSVKAMKALARAFAAKAT